MTRKQIAVLGTVGVPGSYGGFETLAENLVRYHADRGSENELVVYCSARAYPDRPSQYLKAELRYVPLEANGPQSIPYDIWSLFDAVRRGADTLLLLGVSGALALPIIRLLSRARIVTNIDGIEWKREKWGGLAQWVLRLSERMAVRWSHVVVVDNQAIADHVAERYGASSRTIAYGGDHALAIASKSAPVSGLPERYAFALCRIEPENNVAMILEGFASLPDHPLVFVGNWESSDYGRDLRERYARVMHLHLLDPVYDPGALRYLRDRAWLYVHGHSAGGTNPSLVEMMHFAIPILAHGCSFNRHTTEGKAIYFETARELADRVRECVPATSADIGQCLFDIATARYVWSEIGKAYYEVLESQ